MPYGIEVYYSAMSLPSGFLNRHNFELAFVRIVRGANKDYKHFYRHLFPSYNLAVRENVEDLIAEIRGGTYRPSKPTAIYIPKRSGVLRPITLLSLSDLVLYQAICNFIAAKFQTEQERHALRRSFGNILSGKTSGFFYKSWKVTYQAYNREIEKFFQKGKDIVADFDLVSFYELIDHNLLRSCLKRQVASHDLLDLLFECLEYWTADSNGLHARHGIPQGPEASSFLAECLLFEFDAKFFSHVKYLRYGDDIKLMSNEERWVRRALLRLDLASKSVGLVPQAQKIEIRRYKKLRDLLKTVPSGLTSGLTHGLKKSASQRQLMRLFRSSLRREKGKLIIDDITGFKYALLRLDPQRRILKRIAPLLSSRADCGWVMGAYVKKFGRDKLASDILCETLLRDPILDFPASCYIEALDRCEPNRRSKKYRLAVETAKRRSEERSILLDIASLGYKGRRSTPGMALRLLRNSKNDRVKGMVLHNLFGDVPGAPFDLRHCRAYLESAVNSEDPDLARFCAGMLLADWPWGSQTGWSPPRTLNRSVKLMMLGLGLRLRAPKRSGVLDTFFNIRMRIHIPITWRKALGKDWRDAERRCLRLQKLHLADPSARVLILDTFNETLLQAFSQKHPALSTAYSNAAGKAPHPDLGNWVRNPALVAVLPKASKWFLSVHDTRVEADLAHAKQKGGGKKKGRSTKPITFKKAASLYKKTQRPWAELIKEWKTLL